jgi:hypothetical protein
MTRKKKASESIEPKPPAPIQKKHLWLDLSFMVQVPITVSLQDHYDAIDDAEKILKEALKGAEKGLAKLSAKGIEVLPAEEYLKDV